MDAQLCREARAKNLLHRILPEGHSEQLSETGTLQNDEDLYWRTSTIFPAGYNGVLREFVLAALDALLLILLIAQLRR